MGKRSFDYAVKFGIRAIARHPGAKGIEANPFMLRECIRVRGEDNHVDDGHRVTHDMEYAAFKKACEDQQAEMIARAIASPGEFIEPVLPTPTVKKKKSTKETTDKEISNVEES